MICAGMLNFNASWYNGTGSCGPSQAWGNFVNQNVCKAHEAVIKHVVHCIGNDKDQVWKRWGLTMQRANRILWVTLHSMAACAIHHDRCLHVTKGRMWGHMGRFCQDISFHRLTCEKLSHWSGKQAQLCAEVNGVVWKGGFRRPKQSVNPISRWVTTFVPIGIASCWCHKLRHLCPPSLIWITDNVEHRKENQLPYPAPKSESHQSQS